MQLCMQFLSCTLVYSDIVGCRTCNCFTLDVYVHANIMLALHSLLSLSFILSVSSACETTDCVSSLSSPASVISTKMFNTWSHYLGVQFIIFISLNNNMFLYQWNITQIIYPLFSWLAEYNIACNYVCNTFFMHW